MNFELSILYVIPHYGDDEHLWKLLPSIGVTNIDDVRSSIESQKFPFLIVPSKHGEVYIWNNNIVNIGFTAASNEGIRHALNNNFDIVWLLNNDTEIPDIEEARKALSAEFQSSPSTGVVGFKILAMDDPDFIHHAGTGNAFPAGVHKVGRVSMGQFEEKSKEKWVTGASMAISSGCLMETGLLDEKMVNYGSDSDFCFRARHAGYDVVYLPIPVLHKIGQSARPSEGQIRQIRHDMLVFQSKWINGKLYHDLENELTDKPSN